MNDAQGHRQTIRSGKTNKPQPNKRGEKTYSQAISADTENPAHNPEIMKLINEKNVERSILIVGKLNKNTNDKENQAELTNSQNNNEQTTGSKKKPKEFIFSCQSTRHTQLPLVTLNFNGIKATGLLDTGASVSVIEPQLIAQIKTKTKIHYISRHVKISTINNNSIPYTSTASLSFKLKEKWFKNAFFITKYNWQTKYNVILGYDFFQKHKMTMDMHNKVLTINNENIKFSDTDEIEKQIFQKRENTILARAVKSFTIPPNTSETLNLKLDDNDQQLDTVILHHSKLNKILKLQSSIHDVMPNNEIYTLVQNTTEDEIYIRKNSIIGYIENYSE